jgi:hypothetical protein
MRFENKIWLFFAPLAALREASIFGFGLTREMPARRLTWPMGRPDVVACWDDAVNREGGE